MELVLDALRMIRDIGRTSRAVNLWGAALNVTQIIGGIVFVRTVEGAAVLATVVVTLLIAGRIHRRTPFSRLIGLCHLPWLVLLPWLVTADQSMPLRIWCAYVAVTIAVSLLFDAADVYRYSRGERTFSWAS